MKIPYTEDGEYRIYKIEKFWPILYLPSPDLKLNYRAFKIA